ncbi:MAG: DNA-binding protein [Thermoproteota archaeon]
MINENLTVVTLAEFPPLIEYKNFRGNLIYPQRGDLDSTVEIQSNLRSTGKPKPFSDLLIAAICMNRNQELLTKDKDFQDIAQVSNLKVKIVS